MHPSWKTGNWLVSWKSNESKPSITSLCCMSRMSASSGSSTSSAFDESPSDFSSFAMSSSSFSSFSIFSFFSALLRERVLYQPYEPTQGHRSPGPRSLKFKEYDYTHEHLSCPCQMLCCNARWFRVRSACRQTRGWWWNTKSNRISMPTSPPL